MRLRALISAICDPVNGLGLAVAAGIVIAARSIDFAVLAAVAEAAYLLVAPRTLWGGYRRALRSLSHSEAELARTRERMPPDVSSEFHGKFLRMEQMLKQARPFMPSDLPRSIDILIGLHQVLVEYLAGATRRDRLARYVDSLVEESDAVRRCGQLLLVGGNSRIVDSALRRPFAWSMDPTPPRTGAAWLDRAVSRIEDDCNIRRERVASAGDETARLHASVLERRCAAVRRLANGALDLERRLDLLEDSFGLLLDELYVLSPDFRLGDIEGVIRQTESLALAMHEVDALEAGFGRLSPNRTAANKR